MTTPREISSERAASLVVFQEKIGLTFQSLDLLDEALTHSSYSHDHPNVEDYERLEFFGDAVLKFIISEYLFQNYPKHDEGRLTEIRAVLINARTLELIAEDVGLAEFLLVARGVPIRASMIARSMEAVLGAVYLDLGMEQAREFINRFFSSRADAVNQDRIKDNYKAQLQQLTQSKAQGVPIYTVQHIEGPPHDPIFTVSVAVASEAVAQGSGRSKKIAEQEAARAAYYVLLQLDQFDQDLSKNPQSQT